MMMTTTINMLMMSLYATVPAEERVGLSNVINFKLNTSGMASEDVISARLGVYIRRLSSSSSSLHGRRRSHWGSAGQRNSRLSPVTRVQVSDVTWRHRAYSLRRRPVYNVGDHGQWIMFEVSVVCIVFR